MKFNEFFKNNKKVLIYICSVVCVVFSCVLAVAFINNNREASVPTTQKTEKTTKASATTQEQTTQAVTAAETTLPQPTVVKLGYSSVKNDLKIKLLDNKSGSYIKGVAFTADVTDPSGKKTTYTDEDQNGYIYKGNIAAGKYEVKLNVPEGYTATSDTATVTVKDKVAYTAITDINDKVSTTPIKDDTQGQSAVQESALQDTVEFVQSTKTKVPQQTNYISVAFASVKNPNTAESTTGPSTTETSAAETTTGSTTKESTTAQNLLYDSAGNKLYIKSGNQYIPATAGDYSASNTFYKQEIIAEYYKYTGWQTINGNRYYYDKNYNYVTGNQVINGAKYSFNNEGILQAGYGILGIDVSKWQGTIDWKSVKASGVQFVIIRAGVRGYESGALATDKYFETNIKGALAAGLDVGIYFFSQAVTDVEAVEEASLCVELVKNYKIKYPIFIDTETANGGAGRADGLSVAQRTLVCKSFCETIKNSGYKAGVYSCKYYFDAKLDMSQLNQYYIWVAQYNSSLTYTGKYDMWQYSSKGSIGGISTNVDMNLSYMTF